MAKSFYVTTPIYYVNDVPHIGHAYTTIAADALARWKRLKGEEVFFLTGTDEHGQKIERTAESRGETPIELADRVVKRFQNLTPALDITNDDFIRTTEKRHERAVVEIFKRI
ncbi:MAG: class I tRNA ligase family protein, partial [Candidatus Dadabacteria bacterium]|nr:class I tRNA ligase family protein [Candidatus Dadabacteria bacterium]